MKHYIKKAICTTLLFLCVLEPVGETTGLRVRALENISDLETQTTPDKNSYMAYIELYKAMPMPTETVCIQGEDALLEGGTPEIVQDEMYSNGKALVTGEGNLHTWSIDVKEAGLYRLKIIYSSLSKYGDNAIRSLYVNGKEPYFEAGSLTFFRYFTDGSEGQMFETDMNGNDCLPDTKQEDKLLESFLWDAAGYVTDPLCCYLDAGSNTLSLMAQKESLIIDYLEIVPEETITSYEDYLKANQYDGTSASIEPEIIEAEHVHAKSSYSISPKFDRASALTSPQSVYSVKLNTIGGDNWKTVGQWISWTVDVPADGFYRLGCRFRQDTLSGAFVSRSLYIDGKLPFAEAGNLRFIYSSNWQTGSFSGYNGEYLFYLKAGKREIKLQVTLGDFAECLRSVKNNLNTINKIYRTILNITGTVPDPYRDYGFVDLLPDEIAQMAEVAKALRKQADTIADIVGGQGEQTAVLYRMADQMKYMAETPKKIASNFSSFRDNIGALGNWIATVGNQPLELDYLYISGGDQPAPKAEAGFFKSLVYNIKLILMSFFVDYNNVGAKEERSQDSLSVWVSTGRDQAQIIRTLAENSFISGNNIPTRIELVAADALMPAVLSGNGPDVALSNAETVPVNFALRGAALDISRFSDYGDIALRFYKSALTPFTYNGAVYALPETQSFPVLFYRTDLFEEFNWSCPETWDEFYDLIPAIKKKSLDIGIQGGYAGFLMFLFQKNEQLYNNLGTEINLKSDQSIGAFLQLCELFTMYKLPITYDFANRFRTGEIPLAVVDYTNYNQLSVFAPEIAGLWKMAPLPATVDENDNRNNVAVGTCTGAFINSRTKQKDNAWLFLKWWTSADTQAEFGNRMESVLGVAGKQATANIEALSRLNWTYDNYQNLKKQMENTQGVPMVPGSYIVSREIDFAFTSVYNNGDDPIQMLEDKMPIINRELLRKYKEFPDKNGGEQQ